MTTDEIVAAWRAKIGEQPHPEYQTWLSPTRFREERPVSPCGCRMWAELDAEDPDAITIIHGSLDGEARRTFRAVPSRDGTTLVTASWDVRKAMERRIDAWVREIHAYEAQVVAS